MLAVGAINETHEGRWMTPDLLGGDITNPQSLNRYAYALNNPTTLTDPSGLGPNGCAPASICITVPVNPPFLLRLFCRSPLDHAHTRQ